MGPSVGTLRSDKSSPFMKEQDVAFATLLNKAVKPRTVSLWEKEGWTVIVIIIPAVGVSNTHATKGNCPPAAKEAIK
jgi:hypothetical protein